MIIVHLFGILIISCSFGRCYSFPHISLTNNINVDGISYEFQNYLRLLAVPEVLKSSTLFVNVKRFLKETEGQVGVSLSYIVVPKDHLLESVPKNYNDVRGAHVFYLLMNFIQNERQPIVPPSLFRIINECLKVPSPANWERLIKAVMSPELCEEIPKEDVPVIRRFKLLLIVGILMNVYGSYQQMESYWKRLLSNFCNKQNKIDKWFGTDLLADGLIDSLSKAFVAILKESGSLMTDQHYHVKTV